MTQKVPKSINLPMGYWYEIWSQVIARAWSARREVEDLTQSTKAKLDQELPGLKQKVDQLLQKKKLEHDPADPVLKSQEDQFNREIARVAEELKLKPDTLELLLVLPSKSGEGGKREITWDDLCRHKFVAGPEPLNFPKLFLEEIKDGEKELEARYMAKNAFRNINGWAQDLVELGGKAKIMVPEAPALEERAKALDWYVKQGFHMPFAPNNRSPFATTQPITPSLALGFSGGRIGEESATDALNGDAAWLAIFPVILAFAWQDSDAKHDRAALSPLERLLQTEAKEKLRTEADGRHAHKAQRIREIQDQMVRERDALFSQFGYNRPVGLEIEFEFVAKAVANYDDNKGWDDSALRPTLVVRIPPPPENKGLHPIALADYRATGKAQLFTT